MFYYHFGNLNMLRVKTLQTINITMASKVSNTPISFNSKTKNNQN